MRRKYGPEIELSGFWSPIFRSDFGLYGVASLINLAAIGFATASKIVIDKSMRGSAKLYANIVWHACVLGFGTGSVYAATHNYLNCFHGRALPPFS
jgi:hypothetical protein